MKTLVQQLQENPMFKFSMSSLELFHSNFLEWLFNQNPSAFLICFGIDVKTDKDYTIQREYTLGSDKVNDKKKKWITDIAVFAKENGKDEKKLVLIIENKIKSLPSKGQLEAQSKLAGDCEKVLLTLFELPKDYNLHGFTVVKYIDCEVGLFYMRQNSGLIKKIREQYKNTKYFTPYIEDYCKMVETLQQIINEDSVVKENSDGNFTFHKHSEHLEACGMQDAFRKYQAAQLARIANNEFNDKNKYDYKMSIETGEWFHHKRACTNVFFKLSENLDAGVQIEHNKFKVYFEGKAIEKLYDKKTGKLLEKQYGFLDKIWKDCLNGCSSGRKDNCKYGKNFVYRYVIIPGENDNVKIKIDQLLVKGNWLEGYPELSVKYILDKIIENKKDIIANVK